MFESPKSRNQGSPQNDQTTGPAAESPSLFAQLSGSRLGKAAQVLALGTAMLGGPLKPAEADGALMLETTTLPGQPYIDYGIATSLGRAVWISAITTSGDPIHFSGMRYNGWNIVTIDPLTHSASGPLTILEVGNGSNYLTNRGDVVTLAGMAINPGKDESVLHLSSYLPGIDVPIGLMPAANSSIRIGGYGEYSLVSGTPQPADGNIRAFDMRLIDDDTTFVSAASISSLYLAGAARPGYSGAFLENPLTGEAFGRLIGGGLGTDIPITNTYSLYDKTFIINNLNIPEPQTALLLSVSLGALAFRRNRSSNS